MPHEVIMPALGMAQETGVIVSWLKQPGDSVKTGEALMEVETDKAVMEVEALADGFLADVRASAGDTVPVGNVVALISETADAPVEPPAEEEAPAPSASASVQDGKQIIMPALGMTQETGLIVAWLKAPGDAVAADDVLLEVETDKSTMEVPAGHDGYVAALLAEAGQEVPVGDVIAVISASKPETPIQQKAAPSKTAAAPPQEPAAPRAAKEPAKPAIRAAETADGRILASPKARRLAAEQGLDLSRLVAAGRPQPFHVADLEYLRQLPAQDAAAQISEAPATHQISARVAAAGTGDFLSWMLEESGITLSPISLWASFAAAACREATDGADKDLVIEVAALGAPDRRLANPDHARLSAQPEDTGDGPAALVLRDLTGTPITAMRLGTAACPVLSIGKEGDAYMLTLDFAPGQLTDDAAIALITGFAGRMAEPLRHLL